MAAAPEADMREINPLVHDLVLCDEITPQQVLKQKKLFQAGPAPISMGASATNCHAYKAWVHAERMVLCSNTWHLDCSKLDVA